MWTDEQLTEQGWSVEQIATYRTEEATQAVTAAADRVISETINLEPAHSDKILPALDGRSEAPMKGAPQMLTQSPISAILLVAMLVLVPFSLYSISNAEGTQGPSGESGIAGINGSDGSSFHLVSSTDALPVCDAAVNNQIFFIAVDAAFQVCQNSIWTPIDLTGQSGLNGTNGADGTDGLNGSDGTEGNDGADGTDGLNGADGENGADGSTGLTSLIITRNEPNGLNCPNGGTIVETGVDDNRDNALSNNEVDSIVFVCKGENGQDGADGIDGADGANGSSTGTMMAARLSAAPASMGCNGTGELLEQGMDDGRNGGIAQNGILESSEILFRTLICTLFDVKMVEDINNGSSSNPTNFVSINSTMYFTANNGTASGIWAYENGNISLVYSGSVLNIRAIGSQLMFSGQDQGLNVKPYVYEPSNGTAWQITEVFPGGSSYPGEFTLIGTTVFFSARDSTGSTGIGLFDLWAYETLNYSVWKVEADIQPTSLLAVNSDLYFSAGLNTGNTELWKHETSTNTTFMVKDINTGILSSSPENLVLMGTTVYMSANDGSVGSELYAYDVTNNSTWLAADIRPGVAGSMLSDLTVMGTRLYMQATSGTHFELWAYESTNNSFWQVTNFQSTSGTGGPSSFTVFDGKLYFKADDGNGAELWATSPTNGSVWLAQEINPAGASSPSNFYAFGGALFFAADDGTNGRELWSLGAFSQNISFV